MMHHLLTTIHYKSPNIGFIPLLFTHLNHAFSWGMTSPNMSYQHGDRAMVATAESSFLRTAAFSHLLGLVVMTPEHGRTIVDVTGDNSERRNVSCDCLVTSEMHLTLAVKPADCVVAIITTPRSSPSRCLALLHAGRKGIDLNLAGKAIAHIVHRYGVQANELLVGVAPCITVKHHFIRGLNELSNPTLWGDHIQHRDGLYYLDFIGMIRNQFVMSGIPSDNIMQYNVDTFDAAISGESFSHRHWQLNPQARNGRFMVAAELD